MKKMLRDRVNLQKVSRYAIAANGMQIACAGGLLFYALLGAGFQLSGLAEKLLVGATALVVIWGAAMDIRDALNARKIVSQSEMLEEAYGQLEDLNATLRAQRHDFMNHLQVVFGLIEMGELRDAQDYIERVYGDIQLVGRSLKTASPAVNALLAAKLAACADKGIDMEIRVRSAWQGLPVAGWEMCRVLGNLIDNAIDALEDATLPRRRLVVETGEDIHDYTFSVSNTGPEIPAHIRASVFERGFTTKRSGRGMGLAIVAEILEKNGGRIELRSDSEETVFCGWIAKKPPEGPTGDK